MAMVNRPHARSNFPDRKLYVRFPQKLPTESEIKDLSPHIHSVLLPRQKSARFCHIVVQSADQVDQVLHELDKKPFGARGTLTVEKPKNSSSGPKLEKEGNESKMENLIKKNWKNKDIINVVKSEGTSLLVKKKRKIKNNMGAGKRERTVSKEDDQRRVFVKKIPESTTDGELKTLLPGCIWVKMYKFKSSKNMCSALCKFSSYALAKEFVDNPEKYVINGHVPVVVFASNQTLRGSKNKKKTEGENVDDKKLNGSHKISEKKRKLKKGSDDSMEMDSISKDDESDSDNKEDLEDAEDNSDNEMEDNSEAENSDGSEDEDMSD